MRKRITTLAAISVLATYPFQAIAVNTTGMGAHDCDYLTKNWGTAAVRAALVDWANGFVSGLSYGTNISNHGMTHYDIERMAIEAMSRCHLDPSAQFIEHFTDILQR